MKAIFSKDVVTVVRPESRLGNNEPEYIVDERTTTIRLFGIKISEKKELFLHPYETK